MIVSTIMFFVGVVVGILFIIGAAFSAKGDD